MKPPRLLSREAWLRDLAAGGLRLTISFAGFGSYGSPGSPWGFRQRRMDAGICYLLVGGGIRARIAGKIWEVREGNLFLVAPGVLHDFELLDADRPITLYHCRIRAWRGRNLCWLKESVLCLPHLLGLRRHFEDLLEETDATLPWCAERVQASLFLAFSAAFRADSKRAGRRLTLSQQTRLGRFLQENRRRQPAPSELAAALNLSLSYFSRLFKATYHSIPRTWLVAERLRLASLELVETSKGVAQLAEELGYRNPFLFSRQFSQHFGCSPRAFRQKHGSP